MKDANACFDEGMRHIELSWHADYRSELVGDLEDAIAAFDEALALRPDHAQARAEKGIALARLDRHDEAVVTLAEALRLTPDDPDLWLQSSNSLAHLERHEEALAACGEVLRLRPDDQDAALRRAEMLDALGRDADALAAWDEVLRQPDGRTFDFHSRRVRVVTSDVRQLRARLARAGALARLGCRDEALTAYRGVFEDGAQVLHGPSAPPAFADALRNVEPARAAYDEYLRTKADDPAAWGRAGHAFLSSGRIDDALAAYVATTRLAPEDADAWWGMAEALVQAGRRAEAVAAYRESLRIRPGFVAASARLKVVLNGIAAKNADPDRKPGTWTVMGSDTFAREDYLVGEFATEEEARKCVREREARAEKVQDEALRDSYWIVPPRRA